MENKQELKEHTLWSAIDSIVGKKVRVIREDTMDRYFDDKLRWHIGDEFIVAKIEIRIYGCFLHDKEGHSLSIFRAELVDEK